MMRLRRPYPLGKGRRVQNEPRRGAAHAGGAEGREFLRRVFLFRPAAPLRHHGGGRRRHRGAVAPDDLRRIAEELGLGNAEVSGTASFYSLVRQRPAGRHVIAICHHLPCSLMGAESLMDHLGAKLGVGEGEVTPDGRFSFHRIECIGRCDGAPAMLVDGEHYTDLTPERLDDILERHR